MQSCTRSSHFKLEFVGRSRNCYSARSQISPFPLLAPPKRVRITQNGTKLCMMDTFSVQMRRVTDAIHRQTLLFALHFPLMLRKANEIDRHGIGRLRMEKWPSATLGSCSAQWERRTNERKKNLLWCERIDRVVLWIQCVNKENQPQSRFFPSANSAVCCGMPSWLLFGSRKQSTSDRNVSVGRKQLSGNGKALSAKWERERSDGRRKIWFSTHGIYWEREQMVMEHRNKQWLLCFFCCRLLEGSKREKCHCGLWEIAAFAPFFTYL